MGREGRGGGGRGKEEREERGRKEIKSLFVSLFLGLRPQMETYWLEDWQSESSMSEWGWINLHSGKSVFHTEESSNMPQHATFSNAPNSLTSSWRQLIPKIKRELETNKRTGLTGTVSEHLWQRNEGKNWKSVTVPGLHQRPMGHAHSVFPVSRSVQRASTNITHM